MQIVDILSEFPSLKAGFNYILKHNKSNNAPYHNLNHMLTVVKYCHEGLYYMGMLDEIDDYVEVFLLAALFHDFNHSMGRRDDAFNIAQAKLGLEDFVKEHAYGLTYYLKFMHEVIDATQYPYVIPDEELTTYQALIRDADLMQILEPDWITHVILGLVEEMHYPLKDLMVGERNFLKNMKFHTLYGKNKQKKFGPMVWEDFKKLEKLLE